jgi:hypothetical protein
MAQTWRKWLRLRPAAAQLVADKGGGNQEWARSDLPQGDPVGELIQHQPMMGIDYFGLKQREDGCAIAEGDRTNEH